MDDDDYEVASSLQDLGVKSHRMWGFPVIRIVNQDNGPQHHRNWLSKLNDWWIR